MTYKTLIAFMGKKQLQKYKPTSAWERVDNGTSHWTEDFCKIKGISLDNSDMSCRTKMASYVTLDSADKGRLLIHFNRQIVPRAYINYYNAELDYCFYVSADEKTLLGEENIEKIESFLEQYKGNANTVINLEDVLK